MKWLIAFVLLISIPTADVAAQEVTASALASASSLSSAFPEPRPQAINDTDVRGTWELGLGYTFVRFQSSLFSASMSGLDSTVSYYLRDHFAVEGDVTAAFGSQSSDAKYLFSGGGVKVSKGNSKLQPFAHALVGGIHVFPQTVSNNGFAFRLGGGAETRLRQQLWLRVEGDYVRSQLYSSGQNNFQAVASINYRF